MKPMPTCDECGHSWHGLPCPVATVYIASGHKPAPCECPTSFRDQYEEGA